MSSFLPRPDIDAALGSEIPSQAFARFEEKLGGVPPGDQRELRRQIIEALEAAFNGQKPLTANWLRAICDASPNYLRPGGEAGTSLGESSHNEASHEERLCALLLKGLDPLTPSERGALLGAVVPTLLDISLPCALVCRRAGDWTADGAIKLSADSYFGPGAEAVRRELLDRAAQMARSNQIWTQASAASILWFWFACGQEQEAYIFVKRSMRDLSSLASVLELPLAPSETGRDTVEVRRWSRIIDFNTLETRALELVLSGAPKADKARARRFLDAYAHGKSELFK